MHAPHDAPSTTGTPAADNGGSTASDSVALMPQEIDALRALAKTPEYLDEDGILVFAKNPALRARLSAEDHERLWAAIARLCETHSHMVYEHNYGLNFD